MDYIIAIAIIVANVIIAYFIFGTPRQSTLDKYLSESRKRSSLSWSSFPFEDYRSETKFTIPVKNKKNVNITIDGHFYNKPTIESKENEDEINITIKD